MSLFFFSVKPLDYELHDDNFRSKNDQKVGPLQGSLAYNDLKIGKEVKTFCDYLWLNFLQKWDLDFSGLKKK